MTGPRHPPSSILGSPTRLSKLLLSFIAVILFISILYFNENEDAGLGWETGLFHDGGNEKESPQVQLDPDLETPEWPVPQSANESFRHMTGSRHFRDSLSPDKKYVTSFVSAGMANQIISLIHLLQLAQRTGRTPILPPFAPIHITMRAGLLPFSDVFDVQRLEKALGFEVLEWGAAPIRPRRGESDSGESRVPRGIKDIFGANLDPDSRKMEYSNLSKKLSKHESYFTNYFLGSTDMLGCWSLSMAQSPRGDGPRHGDIPSALSLAVSWTPVSSGHRIAPGALGVDLDFLGSLGDHEKKMEAISEMNTYYFERVHQFRERLDDQMKESFPVFASEIPTRSDLEYPNRKEEDRMENVAESLDLGIQIEPDEQVLCFDYLFYSGFEDQHSKDINMDSINIALDTIGMDLHFSPRLLDISWEALSMNIPGEFNASSNAEGTLTEVPNPFPPYIAVHARRNDFDTFCPNNKGPIVDPTDCFTPLSTYAKAVEEVRAELFLRRPSLLGKDIPVIIFSDEPKHMNGWWVNRYHRPPGFSENFWMEVEKLGWKSPDHESAEMNTDERWGIWYSNLIDTVLMSHAIGYVGTQKSTFSLMGAKRVEKWWNGPVRMVSPVIKKYMGH